MQTPADFDITMPENSREFLEAELETRQQQMLALTLDSDALARAKLQFDISEIMIELAKPGMPEAAWGLAKEAMLIFIEHKQWEDAIRASDALYRTELPASVTALGNGLWLSITYPVDPELSIIMLNNLIQDTPDKSDGAAVAAAVAHYLADLRLEGEKRESVMFLTASMLSKVAERHSNVKDQGQMNFWMDKLGLNDPAVFLPRMGQVLDAIVNDQWWYDRDKLRAELPVN